jgi:heat-inducible transcriptional repressor
MADLESWVRDFAAHLGRARSDRQGYRFFVDALMRAQPRRPTIRAWRRSAASSTLPADSSKALVATASQLLSNITHLAGVVTLPLAQAAQLTPDRVPGLSENRMLVVLVYNDREVQNRIIQLERITRPRSCAAPRIS